MVLLFFFISHRRDFIFNFVYSYSHRTWIDYWYITKHNQALVQHDTIKFVDCLQFFGIKHTSLRHILSVTVCFHDLNSAFVSAYGLDSLRLYSGSLCWPFVRFFLWSSHSSKTTDLLLILMFQESSGSVLYMSGIMFLYCMLFCHKIDNFSNHVFNVLARNSSMCYFSAFVTYFF